VAQSPSKIGHHCPYPLRRTAQVLDGLDASRKEAAKLLAAEAAAAAAAARSASKGNKKGGGGGGGGKGGRGAAPAPAPGTSVPVVVCGDFNSNGRTAVWELLTSGMVEASFREPGYPEVTEGFVSCGSSSSMKNLHECAACCSSLSPAAAISRG